MNFSLAVCGLIASALLCFADAAHGQRTDPTFPYQALILGDNTNVHSGPGSVHYATDELGLDAVVEVYRHDPGGWCAIKPPGGSFSLIPESTITKVSNNIGKISEDGVQAWVGTRLGSVEKPLWQVKLKKDEIVEILGEVSWPNPEGHSTIWYQISPPAGEFRWIRISDIKLPRNVSDLPDLLNEDEPIEIANRIRSDIGNPDFSDDVKAASYQSSDPSFDEQTESLTPPSVKNETVNRGWRKARNPVRVADQRYDTGSIEPFKIPAIDGPSRVDPLTSDVTSFQRKLPSANNQTDYLDASLTDRDALATVAPIAGPASQRIRLLESSLTTEMLKSPAEWDLETILRQATSISTSTNDVRERQHAYRLVAKIRNCVTIQSNFESAYEETTVDSSLNGIVGTGVDSKVQFGTTYDAHGWLNQLVRGKGSLQPTYVLEDDKGQIIYHIAPSPGLNLNRYLKSKVGVIGRRGFHRDLNMDHVTAERIVVLDRLRR